MKTDNYDPTNFKVYVTRLGWRTSKYWPWTKLKVGGWFFVPFHKTKSSRALGQGKVIQRVRQSWRVTKKAATWVPGIEDWKMNIVVALHPRLSGGRGRLGVLVTRVE